jgi:hypothetical protein
VLASLYRVLAADLNEEKSEPVESNNSRQSECSVREEESIASIPASLLRPDTFRTAQIRRSFSSFTREGTSTELAQTSSKKSGTVVAEAGNRVAKSLTSMTDWFTAAAHDEVNDSGFKSGKASEFPEIPGEENRNVELFRIRKQYNVDSPVIHKQISRTASFTSVSGAEGRPTTPRAGSPARSNTLSRPHINTLSHEHVSGSFEIQHPTSPQSITEPRPGQKQRRDTLEIPAPTHH